MEYEATEADETEDLYLLLARIKQETLLQDMIRSGLEAILIKVAALGKLMRYCLLIEQGLTPNTLEKVYRRCYPL
ncbi:hypothetical protein L0F63_002165 [Massospora cicadina]|nr:hypothetical protein L0F63_002165 [Massospora cicadina]